MLYLKIERHVEYADMIYIDLLDKYKERYFKQWQKNSSQTYYEKICCVYTSTEKNNLVAVHSLGILR